MVKHIFLFFLLLPLAVFSQEEKEGTFIHKGLFCARGAISYGKMLDLNANNIYLDGNIEYYLNEKVSLRGDGFWFVNAFNGNKPFELHHSLFAGPVFHFKTQSPFDPYFMLEPGINLARASDPCFGDPCITVAPPEEMELTATPLISPGIGFNYYGSRWFHIWCNVRFVSGKFMDNYNSVALNEFRFSFGLGFNIF